MMHMGGGQQSADGYDVCLSFAGEQRAFVEGVATCLREQQVRVFYDAFEKTNTWGKDLYEYLDYIYRQAASYCVIFVSADYARKAWAQHERKSALARTLEATEYILPVRFDDAELPGLRPTVAYVDLRTTTRDELVEMIVEKVRPSEQTPSPPAVPSMNLYADGCVLGYHDETVSSIALRHYDRGIVAYSAGWDNCVRTWHLGQRAGLGEFARADTAIRSIALTRLGSIDVLVAAGDNGTIRGWDASTGATVVEPFQAHRGSVYSVAAAVVGGRTLAVSSGADRKTYSWDLGSSEMVSVISDNPAEVVGPTEIVMLNDRPTLLLAGTNEQERYGFATVYDVILSREVRRINRADYGPIWAVDAVHWRGADIMVTAGFEAVVRSWDLASGDLHSRTTGWPILGISAVKIGPFGSTLTMISGGGEEDGMIRLTDLDTGHLLHRPIAAHRGRVLCLAVADVSGVFCAISGSDDHAVRMQPLWRTASE
jgi:TIR domain